MLFEDLANILERDLEHTEDPVFKLDGRAFYSTALKHRKRLESYMILSRFANLARGLKFYI
jgi:hypothetical protein